MADTEQRVPVHRLDLRIDVLDWAHGIADFEVVTILVDGREMLARVGAQGYHGWHPAHILDPDVAALLPARPARRVGLYRSDSYAGEDCLAAVITGQGDHVIWSDVRDFCGDCHEPTTEHDPDPQMGQQAGIGDLVFDAGQYRAEVARITADLPWETEPVTTARLLRRSLRREQDYLARLGWKLEFAEPHRDGVWVVLRDNDDAQTIVELSARLGTPAERSAAMTEFLLTTSSQQWPVAHCSRCDASSDPFTDGPARTPRRPPEPSQHPAHGPSTRGK